MPANSIQEEIQALDLPKRVQLFEVTVNNTIYRITNSIKVTGETLTPIWWNNHKYENFVVTITGIGYTKENTQERAKLLLSNVGNSFALLFATIPRLDGAKLTYIETFDSYISDSAAGNSSVFISKYNYIFSKFISKNKHQIIYEISHKGDIENKQLPNRRILREGKLGLRFEGAGLHKART